MAAIVAMLLKYGSLLLPLLSHVPDIVNVVENIFGKTKDNGDQKGAAALQIGTLLIPELESAFNVDPALRDIVDSGVSLIYKIMKYTGHLTGVVPTANAAVMAAAAALPPEAVGAHPVTDAQAQNAQPAGA